MEPKNISRFIAELLGTYALVFFGTGAIVIDSLYGGIITHLGISIAFGFIVMAMIYAFGDISGAHINPAVTIGFWISGRFKAKNVIPYIAFQFIGAVLASLSLYILFPEAETMGGTLPTGDVWQSFLMEVIITFFLMLVIIHVSSGSKEVGMIAGLAIGVMVLIAAMIGGPVSGASMNPARTLGPAIISGQFTHIWIYFTAPVIGSILAVLSFKLIR